MKSLIEEKFTISRFERKKMAFFKKFGWKFMPFAQNDPLPDPKLLVPHQRGKVLELLDIIKEGDLVSFIVSDIGMGKTALSMFLSMTLPHLGDRDIVSVFLHGPSIENREQMLRSILERLELNAKEGDLTSEFEQLNRWHKNYTNFLLAIIVDEFSDINEVSLEIVRSIADLKGTVWILNGREEQLFDFVEKNVPALLKRKRYTIKLEPMDLEEIRELLIFRMAWARGGDYHNRIIEPFTNNAVEKVYKKSKGVPREALKLAGDAVYNALEEDETEITSEFIYSREEGEKSFWSFLPFFGD